MEQEALRQLINRIEGFCPEEECIALYSLAKGIEAEGAVLDIGSFKGRTTICFVKAEEEKNSDDLVYAIDVNFFNTKDTLLKNIEVFGVKDWVVPIFSHSALTNTKWKKKPIKLIFIDTDENYFSGACDFLLWEPYLVIGGVIAFGCAQFSSIERLVNDYIVNSHRFKDVTTVGSIVFAYKDKEASPCHRGKIIYIRLLYISYYILRKIFHKLFSITSPHLVDRELTIKKIVNGFFEELLKS